MPSYPADWIRQAIIRMRALPSDEAIAILRAWSASTPLPPLANNPLGMPAGTAGAPRYLTTTYAIFPSMGAFYDALAAFSATYAGRGITAALNSAEGYAGAWRAISALGWPGSKTETDYPGAVLDLASQAYRDHIGAAAPADRRTSGIVGGQGDARPSAAGVAAATVTHINFARNALRATLNRRIGR